MMDVQHSRLSRKLLSDKTQTWPTSPTDFLSTTSTVRPKSRIPSALLLYYYQATLKLACHADVCVCTEALNQGENVDLDALMADLCTIEQELGSVNAKPNSAGCMARLGLTDTKVHTNTLKPSRSPFYFPRLLTSDTVRIIDIKNYEFRKRSEKQEQKKWMIE